MDGRVVCSLSARMRVNAHVLARNILYDWHCLVLSHLYTMFLSLWACIVVIHQKYFHTSKPKSETEQDIVTA